MVLVEKAPEPFERHVGFNGRGIQSVARGLNGAVIEVRGEDLNRRRLIKTFRVLAEKNCDRIRLFSGGTAGHPDSDLIFLALAREELRNACFQRGERFLIAEKMGDANEQVLEERARFRRMFPDEFEILGNGFPVPSHADLHRIIRNCFCACHSQHRPFAEV